MSRDSSRSVSTSRGRERKRARSGTISIATADATTTARDSEDDKRTTVNQPGTAIPRSRSPSATRLKARGRGGRVKQMGDNEEDSIASSRASSAPTETPGPVSHPIDSIPSTRNQSPAPIAEGPIATEQEKGHGELPLQRSAQPPLLFSGQLPDAKTLKALYDASVSAQARVSSTNKTQEKQESAVPSIPQPQDKELVEEQGDLPGLNSAAAQAQDAQDEQDQSEAEMDLESSRASESRKCSSNCLMTVWGIDLALYR